MEVEMEAVGSWGQIWSCAFVGFLRLWERTEQDVIRILLPPIHLVSMTLDPVSFPLILYLT